jgi:hypothetical protein
MKTCKRCGETDFYEVKRNDRPGKFRLVCKTCSSRNCATWRADNLDRHHANERAWRERNSDYDRARRYGLSAADVAALGEHCHACLTPQRERKHHVDHCHETGAVRGLLCMTCNTALGLLQDSSVRCRALADYIERSGP